MMIPPRPGETVYHRTRETEYECAYYDAETHTVRCTSNIVLSMEECDVLGRHSDADAKKKAHNLVKRFPEIKKHHPELF